MATGGWAGDDGEVTTTTSTATTSTTGGSGNACLGDAPVEHLPDCDDLSYASVTCDGFDPPVPAGLTYCRQFEQHGTPEVFEAFFDCLSQIDEDDQCGEAHEEAVRACRDGEGDEAVIPRTCASDLAREKCANMGCAYIDTEPDGTCDVYLSAFTPSGVDHVIACTNEFTEDEPGGQWGAGPANNCDEVFLECTVGFLQPH